MATYYYNSKHVDLVTDGACISCPNCNRYNAMLYDRECNQPSDDFVLKCRDCGAEVVVTQETEIPCRLSCDHSEESACFGRGA